MSNLILLDSVGTWIDDQTLMTYPCTTNKELPVDYNSEFHICDCDFEDWFDVLNEEDSKTLLRIVVSRIKLNNEQK